MSKGSLTGSLRLRFVVALGGGMLLAIALSYAITLWRQKIEPNPVLVHELHVTAQSVRYRLNSLQDEVFRVSRTLAELPGIQSVTRRNVSGKVLEKIASFNGLSDLILLDAGRTVVFNLHARQDIRPFLKVFDLDSPVPQHHFLVSAHGGPGIEAAASAPIFDGTRKIGSVLASIAPGIEICDDIARQQGFNVSVLIPETVNGATTGLHRRVLTSLHNDGGRRLQGSAVTPLTVYDEPDGSLRQIPELGEPGFYVPIASANGNDQVWAEVVAPASVLTRLQEQWLGTFLIVGLLTLAAAMLVATAMAERIRRSLLALRAVVERLGHGEYPGELPVPSADEIGALTIELNQTTRQLEERGRSRGHLQKSIELLEHEKREVESILNTVPEGILVLDIEGRVIRVNDTAVLMLERERDSLLNRTAAELLPIQQAGGDSVELPRTGVIEGFLNRGRRHRLPIEVYVLAMQDSMLQTVGQIIILRDMARKFEVDRLKDDFLAIFTHQLKSPVSALIGYAQILRESRLSPENAEIVDTMRSVGEFLSLQINNILASARLKAGRMQFRLEHFPVMMSFENMARLFAPVARTRDVTLLFDSPGDLFIYADIEKVNDILSNLISNALKFTPAGGTIHVAAHADRDRVALRVSDTGQGIPEDVLGGLFQKFFQVTGEGKGSGLGLYIARTLAEHMNGTVDVQSVLREGSTFTIRLPLGEEAQAGRAAPSLPTIEAPILLADGDRDWNGFFRLFLERQGVARVGQAFNDAELRMALERDRYEAIILGENLGNRAGWAVAKDLRSRPATRDIPILYIGSVLRDDPTGLVYAQLQRPLEPIAVVAKLRQMLARFCRTPSASVTPLRKQVGGVDLPIRTAASKDEIDEIIDRR